jgi:D-sedoheptulose 7-phosphate isomerase
MLEQRIQQHLFESADLHNQAAVSLSRYVAEAAQAIEGSLTAGGKLWLAGTPSGELLAHIVAQAFTGRFERDRPPLAAVALSSGGAATVAQQVSAVGQPADVLLLVDETAASPALLQAARAAHEREMTVVALTGADVAAWRQVLLETDVLLSIAHARTARVLETQLLVLHCLCDAVDFQLLGEQELT